MSRAEERQAIWRAARERKAQIIETTPEGPCRTGALVEEDWRAVRACAAIPPVA